MGNRRDTPYVCQKCKKFIFPQHKGLHIFKNNKCEELIEVCRECKNISMT